MHSCSNGCCCTTLVPPPPPPPTHTHTHVIVTLKQREREKKYSPATCWVNVYICANKVGRPPMGNCPTTCRLKHLNTLSHESQVNGCANHLWGLLCLPVPGYQIIWSVPQTPSIWACPSVLPWHNHIIVDLAMALKIKNHVCIFSFILTVKLKISETLGIVFGDYGCALIYSTAF